MIVSTVLFITALTKVVLAGVSSSGVKGTVYYDGTGSCGREGDVDQGQDESMTQIRESVGACGYSVNSSGGDNRLVAFDASTMTGHQAEYCGREIQVMKPDGTPFEFSEGKLFIGESCPACAGGVRLDLSAKALVELMGDCTKNAEGISYQVLDTMAGPPINSSDGASSSAAGPGGTSVPSSAVSSVGTVLTAAIQPTNLVANSANPATQAVDPLSASAATSLLSISTSSSPSVPIGIDNSPTLTAGASPSDPLWAATVEPPGGTSVPGIKALFAEKNVVDEGEGASNCKRRRRRLGNAH
ncbi:uncharacterized protein I206_103765 [Kwoniella pini CBS 10737]|uniref:Barwin domain-containing protein n=1 Tax=Kwoniella pini CBS 10737 TaxID=1296096 RepID=A0A1B9HSM0_9TREE|nr:uncharacterized protein I206_07714 [Kwoniella pini CBS 10737]OCF46237.1 hypothetical protein I206_07714 [Kwoniella pini CBS 10737]